MNEIKLAVCSEIDNICQQLCGDIQRLATSRHIFVPFSVGKNIYIYLDIDLPCNPILLDFLQDASELNSIDDFELIHHNYYSSICKAFLETQHSVKVIITIPYDYAQMFLSSFAHNQTISQFWEVMSDFVYTVSQSAYLEFITQGTRNSFQCTIPKNSCAHSKQVLEAMIARGFGIEDTYPNQPLKGVFRIEYSYLGHTLSN